MCFLVTFCTTQKVTIRSLAGNSEVLQTSNSHKQQYRLFLHVVRRIAAYLLGGGLVKLAIAQRYLAHRLVAR